MKTSSSQNELARTVSLILLLLTDSSDAWVSPTTATSVASRSSSTANNRVSTRWMASPWSGGSSYLEGLTRERKEELTQELVQDYRDYKQQQQEYYSSTKTPEGMTNVLTTPPTTVVTENMKVEDDFEIGLEDFETKCLRMLSTEIGVKKFLGQNTYSLADLPLPVVMSRFVDTIEDAVIHMRRLPYKWGWSTPPSDNERPTVVVLGTGWAAHAFVKVACTFDLRIIVVSPVNHFVFTPMLASAAVGTVEYRSMTEPIRVSNPTIDNYIDGRAVAVDVERQTLTVQLTPTTPSYMPSPMMMSGGSLSQHGDSEAEPHRLLDIPYDYLLCSVGTQVRSSMVPGAVQYCFNLKTAMDSKRLRRAIGESLEYASLPGLDEAEIRRRVRFVIIGGGPTGVELAGELNDFLAQVCRPRKGAFQRLAGYVSVVLVHGGKDLVPQFDSELRHKALVALQSRGVEVRLGTRTSEVGPDFIRLKEKGSDVEETISSGVVVWAAGNEPVPFVSELLSQLPAKASGTAGRVNVDPWLRCPTHTKEAFGSILVLGDAACVQTPSGDSSLPQTAQVAGQQGAFTARLLNRGYDLSQTPPRLPDTSYDQHSMLRIWLFVRGLDDAPDFTFLNLGLLAYVGGGEALTQVQLGDVPLFNEGGKIAFALWRSVYLVKQVATRNRALVTFDWIKSELFGRDLTMLR